MTTLDSNLSSDTSEDDSEQLLLADIETRQDDVIYRLDELNERVENLIELYNRIRVLPSDDQPQSADATTNSSPLDSHPANGAPVASDEYTSELDREAA